MICHPLSSYHCPKERLFLATIILIADGTNFAALSAGQALAV